MFSATTKENVTNLKNDAKETAYTAKRDMDKSFDSNDSKTITAFANQAGRTVRNYFDNANDQASNIANKVNDEINAKPVRSTMLALGAGFILGMLLRS